MWKNSRVIVRNALIYFIPFLIMTLVAVYFLYYSFLMMQSQNIDVKEMQIQNVLDDVEETLLQSMNAAKEMCIDPSLKRKDMEAGGKTAMSGISKMANYKERMSLCSKIFLNYGTEKIYADDGTSDINVFLENCLKLNENGQQQFFDLTEQQKLFDMCVLERANGDFYLMMMYHYHNNQYSNIHHNHSHNHD